MTQRYSMTFMIHHTKLVLHWLRNKENKEAGNGNYEDNSPLADLETGLAGALETGVPTLALKAANVDFSPWISALKVHE